MVDGGGQVRGAGGALDVGPGCRAEVLRQAHLYPLLQLKWQSEARSQLKYFLIWGEIEFLTENKNNVENLSFPKLIFIQKKLPSQTAD